MRLRNLLFIVTAASAIAPVHAGAYCYNETITNLIVGPSQIFFTTDKSCPTWCDLGGGWDADAKRRAFAIMLAARNSDRTVSLYFNELTGVCSGPVPPNSSPTSIIE